MKIYKLLFLITVLLLFSANEIQADCRGYGTLLDEFKSSAAVFSGKVIAQEYKTVTDTSYTDTNIEVLHVKLKVDRWWKGSGDVEVIVRPGGARGAGYTVRSSDDFRFTSNESYLVFANALKGSLLTNDCSRTRTLDEAEDDLKVLGEGVQPKQTQGCLMITSEPLSTVTPNRTKTISPPGIQKERDMASVFAALKKQDFDCDGISDFDDNCKEVFNPKQMDQNRNGFGDACESKKKRSRNNHLYNKNR